MAKLESGAGVTGWGDERVPGRHYAFLGLLTVLNVINFVDRQLLASFANFIVPDLNLTNAEFGLLTGLVFITFYASAGLFMGALADMFHRPRLVAAGLGIWSLLTAASGLAKGFLSLAVPRMFIGVGESVLTPTAMSMMADRFPPRRLGFAAGFYYMGVPIGVGASLMIAGYLGPAIGWRNCFYSLGAIGLVFVVVMLFIRETPRRHLAAATGDHSRQSFRSLFLLLWQTLRTSPALGLTMGGGVALHLILGAAVFDQLWFVKERGFDRAEIAQITGWIAVFGGILGNMFGGMGSDWWQSRHGSGRTMFLFWIMLIAFPINLAYRMVPADSALFWLGVFCGFFQLGCFYGPTFSTVQELVPPQIRSSVVAFYVLTLNLVGLAVGVTLSGYCIDYMIAQGISEPYSKTLLAFTLLSGLAIPLFFMAGKRFVADRDALFRKMESAG